MLRNMPMKCSRHLVKSSSMRLNLFLAVLVGGLPFLAACNNAAAPTAVKNTPAPAATRPLHDHADEGHDAPRISLADAKKAYDDGSGVIIDVRDKGAYSQEHIKDALHIPLADVAKNMDKLPKGKKIIVYCS